MEIIYTAKFKRTLKKQPIEFKLLVSAKLHLLTSDPFHPSLKTHKLTGKFEGYWSFSVDFRHRIVFSFPRRDKIILEVVGDHSIYD